MAGMSMEKNLSLQNPPRGKIRERRKKTHPGMQKFDKKYETVYNNRQDLCKSELQKFDNKTMK